MRQFFDYDVYVFDCDGVLLDSNTIKIDAMKSALASIKGVIAGQDECVEVFKRNFGSTLEQHMNRFFDDCLTLDHNADAAELRDTLIKKYMSLVDQRYPNAEILPMAETVLQRLNAPCFVASGANVRQLRRVLKTIGLVNYFEGVFGAPEKKVDVLSRLKLRFHDKSNFVMVGDAVADFNAAKENNFDFFGLTRCSIASDDLLKTCDGIQSKAVSGWHEFLN
jgi:phosphoglycolate phosphatase-like HAD superfamily hydrolase